MTKQEEFFNILPNRYFELLDKWAVFIGDKINNIIDDYNIIKNKKSNYNVKGKLYQGSEIVFDFFNYKLMIAILEHPNFTVEIHKDFLNDKNEVNKIIEDCQIKQRNNENKVKTSKKIKIKGDIVITDPCYINHSINFNIKNIETNIGILNEPNIISSTLYGDWSCSVINLSNNEKIGEFCADAGMVIVCTLKDAVSLNQEFEKWVEEHPWCATIIRDFDGEVEISWEPEEYMYKDKLMVDRACVIYGYGNINFKGFQTGF